MWPTLFRIGEFEITTFGLMMFIAFVSAAWVTMREFRARGLDEERVSSVVIAAAFGGILGGKIYYAILLGDFRLLFERAGLVWYGGLIGGFVTVSIYLLVQKIDYVAAADAVAPGLALGYAIGRVGCFLVGDDYGKPTDGALGIAFPKGSPPTTAGALRSFGVDVDPSLPSNTLLRVHPTQLYTTVVFLAVFGILLWVSRKAYARGRVWGVFLIGLGLERFFIEFIRAKDDRFFGDFTVAQVISVIVLLGGVSILLFRRRLSKV